MSLSESSTVRPTLVLAGEICGIPSRLRIGIDSMLADELKSPM
jgi:hypothetical protein